MNNSLVPPLPPEAVRHAVATKYYNLATLVFVLYDHMLTFDTEVGKVWSQRFSLPKVLWFVFRYMTPILQFGSILADHLTTWTRATCLPWMWIRFIGDELVTIATSIVLILRVWVLFDKAYWVLSIMASSLLAQIAVAIWTWQALTVATLPPGSIGCYPTPKPGIKLAQVASIFVTLLILDFIVFLFTILRLVKRIISGTPTPMIMAVMFRDGVLYFLVIFFVNLANVLLILLPSVPTDLKLLNAEFTPNITVIMVSRLFLNLRVSAKTSSALSATIMSSQVFIGNLGEPVDFRGNIEPKVKEADRDAYIGAVIELEALPQPNR